MIDKQTKNKIVNTIGKYKEKYDKLQTDMEELRQAIKQLLQSMLGVNADIDTSLNVLQEDFTTKENLPRLAEHTQSLVEGLKHLAQQHPRGEKEAAAAAGLEPLHLVVGNDVNHSLKQLLSHLAIPQALQDKLDHLQQLLQGKITSELLPSIIDKLTELVIEAFNLEQTQFKNFLYELTNQLHDVDNYLKLTSQKNRESQAEASQLESGIQDSIDAIRDQVDKSKSIEELAAKINQNLGTIGERIKKYRANEQERTAEYEEKVKALQANLMESERSMEEVKSMLSFQQVKINQDSLTCLPNRAAYDDYLLQAYHRWQRGVGELSLAVADIDRFKAINDNYGHLAGDKVLKKAADLFKNAIRSVDFIARYGGEEFIFIFERTSEAEARKILESLRKSIEECQFYYHDSRVEVTVSFGLTTLKPDDDLESLFMRADAAMYQAKRAGRNRVEVL